MPKASSSSLPSGGRGWECGAGGGGGCTTVGTAPLEEFTHLSTVYFHVRHTLAWELTGADASTLTHNGSIISSFNTCKSRASGCGGGGGEGCRGVGQRVEGAGWDRDWGAAHESREDVLFHCFTSKPARLTRRNSPFSWCLPAPQHGKRLTRDSQASMFSVTINNPTAPPPTAKGLPRGEAWWSQTIASHFYRQ